MAKRTGDSVAARYAREGMRHACEASIRNVLKYARHDARMAKKHGDEKAYAIAIGRVIGALTIARTLTLPITMDPSVDDVDTMEPYLACGGRQAINMG